MLALYKYLHRKGHTMSVGMRCVRMVLVEEQRTEGSRLSILDYVLAGPLGWPKTAIR